MSPTHRQPGGRCGASRRTRVTVLVLAVAVHLVVLYAPRAPTIAPPGVRLDLLVHVGVFAAVALSARWVGAPWRPVALALVLEAALSELVQTLFLPQRSGDLTDLAADVLGVALGLWLGARASASAAPSPRRRRERALR